MGGCVGKQQKYVLFLLFAFAFASRGVVRPSQGRLAPRIGKYQGSLLDGVAAPALPKPARAKGPPLSLQANLCQALRFTPRQFGWRWAGGRPVSTGGAAQVCCWSPVCSLPPAAGCPPCCPLQAMAAGQGGSAGHLSSPSPPEGLSCLAALPCPCRPAAALCQLT